MDLEKATNSVCFSLAAKEPPAGWALILWTLV